MNTILKGWDSQQDIKPSGTEIKITLQIGDHLVEALCDESSIGLELDEFIKRIIAPMTDVALFADPRSCKAKRVAEAEMLLKKFVR